MPLEYGSFRTVEKCMEMKSDINECSISIPKFVDFCLKSEPVSVCVSRVCSDPVNCQTHVTTFYQLVLLKYL